MSYHADDTICAVSSAPGGAARGIVRLSGADAIAIASNFFRAEDGRVLHGGSTAIAKSGSVRVPLADTQTTPSNASHSAAELDAPCELFAWPTHRSYTREPVVEFHTLGSPPVLQTLLAALCRIGARLAEPGEFTLRAFLAGRLDLTQAEAVLGVIDAPDRHTLLTALTQLAGGLAHPLDQVRNDLIQLLAELEAGLDFVEEDIRFISEAEISERLGSMKSVLDEIERQLKSRSTESELPQVAMVGPPNVGKSSLFNALAKGFGGGTSSGTGHFVPALVSPQSGTTRDYLSATLQVGETPFELVDTAGMEANISARAHAIEAAAQLLASEQRNRANVRIYCIEASLWSGSALPNYVDLIPADCDIIVLTKDDAAASQAAIKTGPLATRVEVPIVATSSIAGLGLEDLCKAIRSVLLRKAAQSSGRALTTTAARCRESVHQAAVSVRRAAAASDNMAGDELVAAELRVALAELGKVVGAVYTDDLLDRIFKTFCIGK